MPQLCTICTHAERHQIDLAVVRGEQSNRAIARQFGVTHHSLLRHCKEHLAPTIRDAQAEVHHLERIDLNRELAKCFHRIDKISNACDEWLRDPERPDRYNLYPRPEE